MRTAPFPLPRGEYTDETRPWSMQEMFNLRWQAAETIGTRSPEKLQTLPGLKPFVQTADSGRVRGMHNAEGKLVSVLDDTLYRISNAGVAIPIGSLPGEGRVQIDHNQISLGNEVMAVNGSAGYLWNSVTDVYGRITDPGFPGGSSVRFVSGYFVVIEPQGRFAANSAPAAGLQWNTLDQWTSEVTPDPLVAQGVRGNELLLLSTTSGEFFQATPNVRQPFRTKQINFKNVGAAGAHVTFDADGNIFWLGNDGVFYNLNGYSPARISTRMQEDAIKRLDWSHAFAFRWDTVVYWTFPDGVTLGWDYAQRQWHRRGSPDMNRWRPNAMARWNDRWVAGDFQAARLWDCNLEDRYWLEGAEEYLTRFSLPVITDNGNAVRLTRLALRMDTGQTPTVPVEFPEQPDSPTIVGDPPDGTVGSAYNFTFTATGGTPPYTYEHRSGALPAGTAFAADGELSGTPTTMALYTGIVVRVIDSVGLWDDVTVEIEIAPTYIALLHLDGDTVDQMGAAWSGGVPEGTIGPFTGVGSIRVNTDDDNIVTAHDYVADLGTGDFAIDVRIWRDSGLGVETQTDIILGHWFAAGTRSLNWGIDRADDLLTLTLSADGTATVEITGTIEVPYDEWVNVRVVREDGVVYQFVGGVPDGDAAFATALHTNVGLGTNWIIGGNDSTRGIDPAQGFFGYVAEFAIIGQSLGTEAYSPRTTPWPNP